MTDPNQIQTDADLACRAREFSYSLGWQHAADRRAPSTDFVPVTRSYRSGYCDAANTLHGAAAFTIEQAWDMLRAVQSQLELD